MNATVHVLKTWPEYFQPVLLGVKTFEKRRNDRDFRVGDRLLLQEWDPETQRYTGRELWAHVTYILMGPLADPEYCIMSIRTYTPGILRLSPGVR